MSEKERERAREKNGVVTRRGRETSASTSWGCVTLPHAPLLFQPTLIACDNKPRGCGAAATRLVV